MESAITKILTFFGTFFALIINWISNGLLIVTGLEGDQTLYLFFGIFTSGYEFMAVFKGIGLGLVFLIYMFQLFKTFFGPLTSGSEHPIYLTMRTILFSILVIASESITGLMIDIGTVPYQMVMDVGVSAQAQDKGFFKKIIDPEMGLMSFVRTEMKSVTQTVFAGGAIFMGGLVTLIGSLMLFIIAISYLKLFLEVIERYIILAVLIMFAPLCIATGASRSTSSIFNGWFKMFVSQIVLMSMSVFFLKMFANGLGQILANVGVASFKGMEGKGKHVKKVQDALNGLDGLLLGLMILFAWLRTGQRIDAHMSTLGMTAAQSGGGLGAELFMGARAMGGYATSLTNKMGGQNYSNFQQALKGEIGASGKRAMGAGKAAFDFGRGKKPQASQDTMANMLRQKGQRNRSLSGAEKLFAKNSLANGGKLNGNTVLDEFKKGGKLGSHAAVGHGIGEAMGDAIPEGFQATDGTVDGDTGLMSARFTNENGESFDAIFSKQPLGEGSMEVTDSEGNTWYATAQGEAASEFYSGNSNAVDEAVGADAAEYAGGEVDMEAHGSPVNEEGQEVQGFDIDPNATGSLGINDEQELEEIEDDTIFAAEDVNGDLHDMSDMVDENGAYIGEGTMGVMDEDGNFVEADGDEATHMMDEDGNLFAISGVDEDGNAVFETAGQAIGGEGMGATYMAEDVDGNLHDMSGQVDADGNYIGEGTMGVMDEDGNFVETGFGEEATHMMDEDGNLFEMSAAEDGSVGFEEAGMYNEVPNDAPVVEDLSGEQYNMSDIVNEDGSIDGNRFSMDENGNLMEDANGDIVQASNGAMFNVDSEGQPTDTATTSMEKVSDTPSGVAGARFAQRADGTMVPSANGDYVQTSSGSFLEASSNGMVDTYSSEASESGPYVGYTNENGGTSYAKAQVGSDGSILANEDGSIPLANGKTVSAESYASATAGIGSSAALTDINGQQFQLGQDSFNENGDVQTFAPVMQDGQFAYDEQGNQLFEPKEGAGYVRDSSGQYRDVGAAALDSQALSAGSTMRNTSGEQFQIGSEGVDSAGNVQRYAPIKDADGNIQMEGGKPQYQPSNSGSYVMDTDGNMQQVATSGAEVGSGALKFQTNNSGGDYVKTASEGTVQTPDGSNYAQLAPTSSLQRYEKTDQGFKPSINGSYVQGTDSQGNAQFQQIASEGVASNGEPLRYSKSDDGSYVRDNNGLYVATQTPSGEAQYSRVSDASISHNTSPQRYSYDTASKSYVPDPKGDSVQTYDKHGNIQYSKLDRSSISDKGIATYNKSIKGGAHSIPIQPATGKTVEPIYTSTGTNAGDYFKSNGKMYSLNEPGSLNSKGEVQRYSLNPDTKRYYKDDNGEYVRGRAEGATTSTYRKVGQQPVERFSKGYQIGSARVNSRGEINIGYKDKMVNNKDGTIDLQFSDGRTARLASANMYKTVGDSKDPSYVGKIQFGGSQYHYVDTTPAYKSFGKDVRPGSTLRGNALNDVKTQLQGDTAFSRKTTRGSNNYQPMKNYKLNPNDVQQGKVATYVKTDSGYRPATKSEVSDVNVEKFVQQKVGGRGLVQGNGFNSSNRVKEAYYTESKIDRAEIGRDGNLYIYNQPHGKTGKQDVYCAISAKSGKVPREKYETKTINNEQYYVVKRTLDAADAPKSNLNVNTVNKRTQFSTKMKDGINIEKRAPKKYNKKVDNIMNK